MTEAMRRADLAGAGFVAVRNSTHFGAGGNYSMMALSRDMVGIALTKGPKEALVPGSLGRGGFINVISIAAPAGTGAPFVLDMATTVVAAGKLEIKRREGKSLPEGWAVDKDGRHMADPGQYRAEGSALLPLGGSPLTGSYKGFGLSVAVEVLCGLLSGSAFVPAEGPIGPVSHFFGALRIDGFGPPDEFKRSMDEMAGYYRSLPKAPGVDRVCLAGEPEWEIEKIRKNGIPLHSTVVRSLRDMASELGLEFDIG
jgi:LDH2 family malate/lactate/ureidoglycolate dehydrogenase